jgi:uncharacterized protein
VSISLDGPPIINDKLRVDRKGHPTSPRVLNGIEALRAEGHPLQILCVITPEAIGRGGEIYHYFRSMGTTWMDFLLPHANARHSTILPQDMPSQIEYAQFLIDVYKEWMNEGDSSVCVRRLRDYSQLLLGAEADTCIFSDDCSYVITILPDGNVFACDDLLSTFPESMGSLQEKSLSEIQQHSNMRKVCKGSDLMFGSECLECDYFDVCRSGCTNFRATDEKTFVDRYYYCLMSKIVIDYVRKDIIRRLVGVGIMPAQEKPSEGSQGDISQCAVSC